MDGDVGGRSISTTARHCAGRRASVQANQPGSRGRNRKERTGDLAVDPPSRPKARLVADCGPDGSIGALLAGSGLDV